MAVSEDVKNSDAGSSKLALARERGNKLVKLGKFEEAREAYAEALIAANGDQSASVPLLANRALAALRLGCHADALADCDRVLASAPEHKKALFRRGQALVGLDRFDEAAEAFTQLRTLEPNNDEVQAELKQAKAAVAQASRGEFDFRAMLAEAALKETLQLQHSLPTCEFRSEAMELVDIPSKGRCWRALRPIEAGELLLVARPLVFATYEDFTAGNHQVLVDKVLSAANRDSKSAAQLTELCGARDAEPPLTGTVVEETAREILRRNCVACATGVGLWQTASFFNHADVANVTRSFIADWALVRAKQDIAAAAELTLSYIDSCADYESQASWLESLGIADDDLRARASRWADARQPHVEAIRASFSEANPQQWPAEVAEESPLKEQRRYLEVLCAEQGKVWCWGQLVRWLRNQKVITREKGQLQRAMGAALAIAELVSRHAGDGSLALEAWADCAAMLFELPESVSSTEEHGEVMGLCIGGVQRGTEFLFGSRWADDTDFSTLVLEWATLRWYHAFAWGRQAAGSPASAEAAPATADLGGMD